MDTHHFLIFLFFLLLSCHALTSSAISEEDSTSDFVRRIDRESLGLRKKEKLSHFKFYWHDIVSGPNVTSVTIVPSPQKLNSTTFFGSVTMIDNPLTLGPNLSSKLEGRSQGFIASASQGEAGLLMAMNIVFIEGKYNGSTITILGRNPFLNKVREMPVIGGGGRFRFATGYVEARTTKLDPKSRNSLVQYNLYVLHY